MNWTDKNSLLLTKISMGVLAVFCVICLVFTDMFTSWIIKATDSTIDKTYFMYSLRAIAVVGLIILYDLYALIKNISNNKTFSEINIRLLRRLSWECMMVVVICLISTIYFTPWLIVGGVACFIAIILRVIKNVFCQAHVLKEESDYTI